ncbi:MAG: STAS domain-containing protein [Clostridia bacterium]|nr:STAS domain-containing protein [Clostridia bacterium]
MTVTKTKNDNVLTVAVNGRLDTTTAPELEAQLRSVIDGVTLLTFDLTDLEYISSAGLRVLMWAQRIMNSQGEMKVCNVNETVEEIFDITGFSEILTIVK